MTGAAADGPEITVSRVSERTAVLGPGLRAVVWVRGCPLRCPDCISPEDLPFDGGTPVTAGALAARLNALPAEITGVTFSGGEPTAQAGALAELVDRLRGERDWSVLSYSGFTLQHLRRHGDAGVRRSSPASTSWSTAPTSGTVTRPWPGEGRRTSGCTS